MAEYIDRDLALSFPLANGKYDKTNADEHFINGCETYREWLESLPAEDVRPVVRGTWVYDDEDIYPHCSECLTQENGRRNFCPNCGADMRGREGRQ